MLELEQLLILGNGLNNLSGGFHINTNMSKKSSIEVAGECMCVVATPKNLSLYFMG